MKPGYPYVNEAMDCSAANTFRLASHSNERLLAAVTTNLVCLRQILKWKVVRSLLFFRVDSGIVPFGSHPINTFPWQMHFAADFRAINDYLKANNPWMSFHPDQFVMLNSLSLDIVQRSIQELVYQGSMFDLTGLDSNAKLQIHVGGLCGEREPIISRFAAVNATMPTAVEARVVVENDDRLFPLCDCLHLHELTGVPILFDNFHHDCLSHGESMAEALRLTAAIWHSTADGVPMMDYGSQAPGERKGKHTDDLVDDLFRGFRAELHGFDMDLMLEVKNKKASALCVVAILRELGLNIPAPNIPRPSLVSPADPIAPPKVKRLPRQPAVAR